MSDLANLQKALLRCDSYSRLPTLLSYADSIEPSKWLKLLGENWDICDNVSEYLPKILTESPVAERSDPITEMMEQSEIEVLEKLFDGDDTPLDIYRGCYRGFNENGHCYSLSEKVAARFPFLNRYRVSGGEPILRKSFVCKNDIVAYKNGRKEHEIIVRRFTFDSDTVLQE